MYKWKVTHNSSGRSAHSAVQTVKKTKTGLELGNLYAKLAQFRNRSALGRTITVTRIVIIAVCNLEYE